jgi:hypothetical protein
VDESNVHLVFAWEDEQYRRRYWQIKTERKYGERFRENKAEPNYRRRFQPLTPDQQDMKLDEDDHPENPGWRLNRAVGEVIEAGYPSDAPKAHAEQSRKIVGLAVLLVWSEPLPVLGELGRWDWESKPNTTWEADPANPDFWRWVSQTPAQDGPHKSPLHMLHARHVGREEVLFHRNPGEPRELQHQWGDLSRFRELLSVAVDELESAAPRASDTASLAHLSRRPNS